MRTLFGTARDLRAGFRTLGVVAAVLFAACGSTSGLQPMAPTARNVVFFLGDGMGISTVTAARIFAVGVDGELSIDTLPYTAFSRTYSADSITSDSAPTMSAMMTGVRTNQSVIGLTASAEPNDFNDDGDGPRPWTLLELAKTAGMRVGVVTTARVTHATPAATFAHIHQRNDEDAIILQALASDATYNSRLGTGIDVLLGGGRRFFLPAEAVDEEGRPGIRTDGRDLRREFELAGYRYVWNTAGFEALTAADLPVLGLFESDHMRYEAERVDDAAGEPSLAAMTRSAIRWLSESASETGAGYFLVIEGGRIDHAHHDGNAHGALRETVALDDAVGAALELVDLDETLVLVTADHGHTLGISGYPMRPPEELPYRVRGYPDTYLATGEHGHGVLDVVYALDQNSGEIRMATDADGVPYAVLGYLNGPGHRDGERTDPTDTPPAPWDDDYRQESVVPLALQTHSGEDVGVWAVGAGADLVHGTVPNTALFGIVAGALGLDPP